MQSPSPFLPPEKAPLEVLRRQGDLFSGSAAAKALDKVPVVALVLNRFRQIVYHNPSLGKLLRHDGSADLVGLRLGEALGCIHTQDCGETCGSTPFCRYCGAAKAILFCLRGSPRVMECRITRRAEGVLEALTFQAWVSPLEAHDGEFLVATLLDISHEKRLQMLEMFFYHDLLNTTSGMKGLCHLLREDVNGQSQRDVETLIGASQALIDQIRFQRDFSKAEKRELVIQSRVVGSLDALRETVDFYRRQRLSRDKMIELARESEEVVVETDRTILVRCLGNLVKNALEACQPRDAVTVACAKSEEGARFTVRNPGVMSEDVRMQIFKRSFSTKGTGRGLGAYSVKLFVESYLGGRVWFESDEAEGTTFFLELPLKPPCGCGNA